MSAKNGCHREERKKKEKNKLTSPQKMREMQEKDKKK